MTAQKTLALSLIPTDRGNPLFMTTIDFTPSAQKEITGIVLCGGRGSRMGNLDKGLVNLMGSPLILHVLQRLKPQVGEILVNANRNLSAYQAYCDRVLCDPEEETFDGPLAGFRVGLEHAQTPLLLTVPCDCPVFPLNLAKRLFDALVQNNAQLAMVRSIENGVLRSQPVFSLMRTLALGSLKEFMSSGGRKIEDWTNTLKTVMVDFDQDGDNPLSFSNINTTEQLQALQNALLLKDNSMDKPFAPLNISPLQA
jgi:molybdopterin-guanine dinucleotide biosynthesis protein A